MASTYRFPQESELPEEGIKSQNRQALRLLDEWIGEPDDPSDQWWQEFERYLQEHRFSIRRARTE